MFCVRSFLLLFVAPLPSLHGEGDQRPLLTACRDPARVFANAGPDLASDEPVVESENDAMHLCLDSVGETPIANCAFYGIAERTLDAFMFFGDTDEIVFPDRRSYGESHCQIITKQHMETFRQTPPELATKVVLHGKSLVCSYSRNRAATKMK